MLVVTKFGGSSLSCATQFAKVKNIILSDAKRKIVVVSALGKKNSSDSKITDLLYTLYTHLKFNVPYEDIWNLIYNRFIEIKNDLNLEYDVALELSELKEKLNKTITEDFLVSRGEYFTAKLMSSYLGYKFVDAKDLIAFDYDGKIDYEVTEKQIQKAFDDYGIIVVPGFYGSYPNGKIKLLSRGGSDVTGSILAKALTANLYENWTDVSGILSSDPRIISSPKSIKEITYAELRELSYMGANVLHEETVFPVQSLGIPINLRNTNDPNNPGTLIKTVCEDKSQIITGIAGKLDFVSFNISKKHMSNEVGFLKKSLEVFEKFNVSVEHIPSGIDCFSIVVSQASLGDFKYSILAELKRTLNAEVSLDEDIALIAVVGRNMAHKIGLSGRLFSALGQAGINIKLLAQGPSELNIIVGVSQNDYEEALRTLYKELLEEKC